MKVKDKIIRDPFKPASEEELRRRRIQYVTQTCQEDYIRVAATIGADVALQRLHLQALPPGKTCVFVFLWKYKGICLKVVKATTQEQLDREYNPEIKNSLACAVYKRLPSLGSGCVDNWIKENTDRFDFVIDNNFGEDVCTLLEVFLRIRLAPQYQV